MNSPPPLHFLPGVQHPGSRTYFRSGYCEWSAVGRVQHRAVRCLPLRMARSGAMALWCQTVISRVQGNTINTMARISLLFGISRIGYLARHYLGTRTDENHLVSMGQKYVQVCRCKCSQCLCSLLVNHQCTKKSDNCIKIQLLFQFLSSKIQFYWLYS